VEKVAGDAFGSVREIDGKPSLVGHADVRGTFSSCRSRGKPRVRQRDDVCDVRAMMSAQRSLVAKFRFGAVALGAVQAALSYGGDCHAI
jgi:hypothetical protein